MKSQYLDIFKKLIDENIIGLQGNRILIEFLKEEERVTKSGIILSESKDEKFRGDKAQFCIVLATGPGQLNEDNELKEMSVKLGDMIMVNQYQVKWLKDFFGLHNFREGSIGLIEEESIHICVFDQEKFLQVLKG